VTLHGPLIVKSESEYQIKNEKDQNSPLKTLDFTLFWVAFFVGSWLEIITKLFDFLDFTFLL
jgi:hypothetical protein